MPLHAIPIEKRCNMKRFLISTVIGVAALLMGPSLIWAQHGHGGHSSGGHSSGGHSSGGHSSGGHSSGGHSFSGHGGSFHGGSSWHGGTVHGGSWHGGTVHGGSFHNGYYHNGYGHNHGLYGFGYYPGLFNYWPNYGYSSYDSSPSYYVTPSYYYDPYPDTSTYYGAPAPVTPSYSYAPSTIVAPSADASATIATVEVRVPPDAQLWVDGTPTKQTGESRTFVSPPLDSGQSYSYAFTARWMKDGKPVEVTKRVDLAAGQKLAVDFTTP
jgi:uncharacterized protein (TIGR03000 family)